MIEPERFMRWALLISPASGPALSGVTTELSVRGRRAAQRRGGAAAVARGRFVADSLSGICQDMCQTKDGEKKKKR